jgi:membrane associated rhomboid family serine protease
MIWTLVGTLILTSTSAVLRGAMVAMGTEPDVASFSAISGLIGGCTAMVVISIKNQRK